MNRIRTLDLFCGGGGSSLGAQAAGAEIVCGVDAWSLAVESYALNFPTAKAVQLRLHDRSSVSQLGSLGRIDLLLASPECTNHTCARGNRPKDADSQRSARFMLNFASKLKPRWMVIENVVHMRSWDGYEALLASISKLGYAWRVEVLDAAEFGVPQTRRRMFILCDREEQPAPLRIPRRMERWAEGILDPPNKWKSKPLYDDCRARNTLIRAERAISELGPGVPFLIVYYGSDGSGGWQPLDRPLRTITTLDRFGLVTWVGKTPMLRMLQVPELRRAMGMRSSFAFAPSASRRDCIRILGNGVAPPVMQAVVEGLSGSARRASTPRMIAAE